MVPIFRKDTQGNWIQKINGEFEIHEDKPSIGAAAYRVRHYCQRIEGLFARIERWMNLHTREIQWRSITRDNITSLYGKDNNLPIGNWQLEIKDVQTKIVNLWMVVRYVLK